MTTMGNTHSSGRGTSHSSGRGTSHGSYFVCDKVGFDGCGACTHSEPHMDDDQCGGNEQHCYVRRGGDPIAVCCQPATVEQVVSARLRGLYD